MSKNTDLITEVERLRFFVGTLDSRIYALENIIIKERLNKLEEKVEAILNKLGLEAVFCPPQPAKFELKEKE